MVKVVYSVVEHDGGWAYKADGVFSETFRSRDDAHAAAEIAAAEQMRSGDAAPIEYQSADGKWHVEGTPGDDRPSTDIED